MVDEIVVGFEDPRVLKAGEPEARLWSSLPNREPVAHQNPGAMVSEPTRRASWVRHVESDSPPSGNRPRVTISGTRYKAARAAAAAAIMILGMGVLPGCSKRHPATSPAAAGAHSIGSIQLHAEFADDRGGVVGRLFDQGAKFPRGR